MNYPAQRRDRVRQSLIEEGLSAVLVTQPLNVTYLSGFTCSKYCHSPKRPRSRTNRNRRPKTCDRCQPPRRGAAM